MMLHANTAQKPTSSVLKFSWRVSLQHKTNIPIGMVMACCVLGCGVAWSQETQTPEPADSITPNSHISYSLGSKLEIPDLHRFEGLKLRPTIGIRYGRWRIGAADSQSWASFGQALQDSNLTYDWLKDTQWQTSLSASVINLDKDATFDAFRAGRKTLRASATLNYKLNRRWILGLNATQDLFNQGDGTSVSPTLTYIKPLDKDSAFLLSLYTTWANESHWQSLAARDTGSALRKDTGLGSWGAQITYRQRWSAQWAIFSQLSTSRLIEPSLPVSNSLSWGGQLGIIYFSH